MAVAEGGFEAAGGVAQGVGAEVGGGAVQGVGEPFGVPVPAVGEGRVDAGQGVCLAAHEAGQQAQVELGVAAAAAQAAGGGVATDAGVEELEGLAGGGFALFVRLHHAIVDGASPFQIYWKVFLPISLPALATVAILLGIETWNQYLWPLLVTQSNYARPISVGIAGFFGSDSIYWNLAMAASVVMMIPVLILYLFFQKWFVSSVISSGVKG